MAACALLLVLATVAAGVHCVCDRIFIKGLDPKEFPYAQSHEGVYKRVISGDHSMYVHETMPMQLLLLRDTMLFQPLGDNFPVRLSVDFKRGFDFISRLEGTRFYGRAHKHPFRKIIDSWIFNDDITGEKVILKADIQIECTDDRMHRCSANTLRFNQRISQKTNGEFRWAVDTDEEFVQSVGQYMDQRPVYYSMVSGNVLFYMNESWVIAPSFVHEPIVRARDSSYLPEFIGAYWEVSDNHWGVQQWRVRRHLHLLCAESIEDVLGSDILWCSNKLNPCSHGGKCHIRELRRRDKRHYCLCQNGYSGTLCGGVVDTCPRPEVIRGVQHVSFAEKQVLGDVAVTYCNQEQYLTSVCGLDNNGQVKWRPDNRVRCTSDLTDLPEKPSRILRPVPVPQSVGMSSEASTVESATETSTMESSTQQNKETVPSIQNTNSSTIFNATDIQEAESLYWRSVFKWMAITVPSLLLVWFYPTYHFYKLVLSQKDFSKHTAHRELHIKKLSDLYEERDNAVELLRDKHPKLLFSREDGVFVKDTGAYTETEKREIAAEYHRLYTQCAKDIEEAEKHHQEDLKKIINRKANLMSRIIEYCYLMMLLCSFYYLLDHVCNWNVSELRYVAIFSVVMAYVIIVMESINSKEAKCVFRTRNSIIKYIEALKHEQPLLIMAVEVSRKEVKVNVDTEQNGSPGRMYTTQDKVVVTNQYCAYNYTAWKDTSEEFMQTDPHALYRVSMDAAIDFADEALYFEHCRKVEQSYTRHNHFVDFTVTPFVKNFEPEVVLCGDEAPWWLSSRALFTVASLFTMSWMLRREIQRRTIPAKFTLRKTLYNAPARATKVDAVPYNQHTAAKATIEIVKDLEKNRKHQVNKAQAWKPIYRSSETLC